MPPCLLLRRKFLLLPCPFWQHKAYRILFCTSLSCHICVDPITRKVLLYFSPIKCNSKPIWTVAKLSKTKKLGIHCEILMQLSIEAAESGSCSQNRHPNARTHIRVERINVPLRVCCKK